MYIYIYKNTYNHIYIYKLGWMTISHVYTSMYRVVWSLASTIYTFAYYIYIYIYIHIQIFCEYFFFLHIHFFLLHLGTLSVAVDAVNSHTSATRPCQCTCQMRGHAFCNIGPKTHEATHRTPYR